MRFICLSLTHLRWHVLSHQQVLHCVWIPHVLYLIFQQLVFGPELQLGTSFLSLCLQIHHSQQQVDMNTLIYETTLVIHRICELWNWASGVGRVTKICLDFSMARHQRALLHCAAFEMQPIDLTHQWHAREELLRCIFSSRDELKAWWELRLLSNFFWFYGNHKAGSIRQEQHGLGIFLRSAKRHQRRRQFPRHLHAAEPGCATIWMHWFVTEDFPYRVDLLEKIRISRHCVPYFIHLDHFCYWSSGLLFNSISVEDGKVSHDIRDKMPFKTLDLVSSCQCCSFSSWKNEAGCFQTSRVQYLNFLYKGKEVLCQSPRSCQVRLRKHFYPLKAGFYGKVGGNNRGPATGMRTRGQNSNLPPQLLIFYFTEFRVAEHWIRSLAQLALYRCPIPAAHGRKQSQCLICYKVTGRRKHLLRNAIHYSLKQVGKNLHFKWTQSRQRLD